MNVQITINERPLKVEKGITILQAARQHAIYIPTLCDYPGLPAYGSCRLCIVEIQGQQNTPTACTTPVEEGMVILTGSPKVQLLRDELLKMLLAEHPSSCLFCPEKGHCDECMVTLRKAGVTTGCRSCHKDNQCELQDLVEKSGLDQVDYPVRYRMLPVEKNDPFFDRDYNLCVLCGRCIRTCAGLHFNNALAFTERGTQTLVGVAFNRTHLEAGCSFCGACVEICPTGALAEKTRKWEGKPDQETTTTCPLCSLGCQMRLLSKNNTVIGSLPDHSSGSDSLCVKGRFGITELVNHPTRLKQPQRAAGQSRLGIVWDEAIRLAAEKLTTCPPAQFEMIVSSSCTNEDIYIAQKFTRQVMQSRRIHTIDQDGHADDMDAFIKLLAQSQPLSVLAEAQVILCLGLDEQYFQSVVEVKLHQAKDRGARIIVAHSQEHNLRYYADEWLQPLPGKEPDLIYELLERAGKPPLVNSGRSSERPVDRIEQAARLLQESSNITVIVGPSFLDHAGQARLLEAVDRLINRLGARVIVLPDQGNLSGSLLLGISPSASTYGSQELEVLYLVGENVPVSFPGHPFVIYQNIYPPSPGRQADLVLPAAAFSEEEGTFINHAGRLQEIHRSVPPPGEALPTWEILCRIAQKMGAQGFDYACVADIRAEIAGFIEGFQVGSFVDLSPSVLRGSSLLRYDRVPTWSAQQNKKPAGAGEADGRSLLTRQTHLHTYMGFPLAQWVAGLRQLPSQFRGLPSQFRGLPPLYPDKSGQEHV